MYGMVNKYIIQTIQKKYGIKKWTEISSKIATLPQFIQSEQYSDDITYSIIGESVKVIGIDANSLLEILGEGWITETAQGNFGNYYELYGSSLFAFLQNLDNMHAALGGQMNKMIPPSFICKQIDSNTIYVRYISARPGLTYFVKGLLKGLCEMFSHSSTIEIKSAHAEGTHYDEFLIKKAL